MVISSIMLFRPIPLHLHSRPRIEHDHPPPDVQRAPPDNDERDHTGKLPQNLLGMSLPFFHPGGYRCVKVVDLKLDATAAPVSLTVFVAV